MRIQAIFSTVPGFIGWSSCYMVWPLERLFWKWGPQSRHSWQLTKDILSDSSWILSVEVPKPALDSSPFCTKPVSSAIPPHSGFHKMLLLILPFFVSLRLFEELSVPSKQVCPDWLRFPRYQNKGTFFLESYLTCNEKHHFLNCILSQYLLLSKSYKKFDTLVAATAVHVVTVVHQSWEQRKEF